jgi:hypothetical protein
LPELNNFSEVNPQRKLYCSKNKGAKIAFQKTFAKNSQFFRVSLTFHSHQQCKTLVNEKQPAGTHRYTLQASALGLASGVYFYRLQAREFSATKKMLFLK